MLMLPLPCGLAQAVEPVVDDGPRAESPRALDPVNAVIGDASWLARHGEGPGPGASQIERIQTHLEFVEGLLREADRSHLTPAQRAKRGWALDALARYRRAGEFPRRTSDDYEGRHPRFIDDRGVHCAVGEMMAATGHPELAATIDREHEYALVLELDSPRLRAWAEEFGFTPIELAMIQPGYDPPPTAETMRQVIESSTEKITLQCAARTAPVRRFRMRVRGDREGRVRVRSISRNHFVRCFVEQLDGVEIGGGAWEESPEAYRFGTAIEVESPQRILERRFAELRFDGRATSCIPRPGATPDTAAVHVQVGAEGLEVEVRTTPSNPEVDRCLSDRVRSRLAEFMGGRWRLELRAVRSLGRQIDEDSLASALESSAPQVATDCYEPDRPSRATVRVRAVPDAPSFEIEVDGGGADFAACVEQGLGERLESQFSVSRQLPDGSYERYFRIDGGAEVTRAFEVETPQAREDRVEEEQRELEEAMVSSIRSLHPRGRARVAGSGSAASVH